MVQHFVDRLGADIKVQTKRNGRMFLVPRHYIALHGLKEAEIENLGFKEIETADAASGRKAGGHPPPQAKP